MCSFKRYNNPAVKKPAPNDNKPNEQKRITLSDLEIQ